MKKNKIFLYCLFIYTMMFYSSCCDYGNEKKYYHCNTHKLILMKIDSCRLRYIYYSKDYKSDEVGNYIKTKPQWDSVKIYAKTALIWCKQLTILNKKEDQEEIEYRKTHHTSD